MLIRGQTTEERIGEIASKFAQGINGATAGMKMATDANNENKQQDLLKEREARQRAIQELDVEAKLTEQTGRNIIGSGLGSKIMKGEVSSLDFGAFPLSRKAQLDEQDRVTKAEDRTLNNKLKQSNIDKNNSKANNPVGSDKVAQKQMEKLGVGNAGLYNVKSAMDEALKILNDPAIGEDQKIKTGQGLFKLLNSAEGSDAVGAEEAKRIGSYLEYNIGNFTQPGAFIGRDVKGFTDQVSNYSSLLGNRISKNEQGINALRSGGTLSQAASSPAQPSKPQITQQHVNAIKSMSDADLLKFVQGG